MLTIIQCNVLLQCSGVKLGIGGDTWVHAMRHLLNHGYVDSVTEFDISPSGYRHVYRPTAKGREYLTRLLEDPCSPTS